MTDLYQGILEKLGDTITINCTYCYSKNSHLCAPQISHNITNIKYSDIFRVYCPDPDYVLVKTKHVSNWSGIILDDKVREYINVGNIL